MDSRSLSATGPRSGVAFLFAWPADKTSFSTDEWVRIVASPMVAGIAITAADPSGLWGLLREGMAGGWALLSAKQSAGTNLLVKAVAEDFTTAQTRDAVRDRVQAQFKGSTAADLKGKAIEELRQVATILDRSAGADAAPL